MPSWTGGRTGFGFSSTSDSEIRFGAVDFAPEASQTIVRAVFHFIYFIWQRVRRDRARRGERERFQRRSHREVRDRK